MSKSHATLKLFRQTHLYIGVFISPALIFFAFTGALQTFSLHEATRGSDYKPPAWAVTLGQIHKKQTSIVPVRPPRPKDATHGDHSPKPGHADASASTAAPDGSEHPKHSHADPASPSVSGTPLAPLEPPAAAKAVPPPPAQKSHLPLKIFFLLVAIGLFTSTVTGIYMSYKYTRRKWLITVLLLAGVIIPPLLLPF